MVSSPGYDPDELVGRDRGNNYMKLLANPRRPLFNRGVMSRYPPGSTFKLVNGLIGILVQTQTAEIQLVVVSVGDGFIQLVTAGRHVVKLGKIYICAVFAVQKCLGVEVVIIEMEIHVEIVLSQHSFLSGVYASCTARIPAFMV